MANKTRKNRTNKKKFRGGSKTITDVQNFIKGKINEHKNSGNERAYIYEDVYQEILSFINTNTNTKVTITRPITPKPITQKQPIKTTSLPPIVQKEPFIIGHNHITGAPIYNNEPPVRSDLIQINHNGYWNPGY